MRTLFVFLLASLLTALSPTGHAAEKLKVVTRNIEPFSFETDGRRVGYAMELWEQLAREAGLEYEVRTANSAAEMIAALSDKSADVGVGALSVTAKREEVMDFSQPFYESGLQVLVAGTSSGFMGNVKQLMGNLFNWQLIGVFVLLVVVMFVISHLVWKFEHKENDAMWPKEYRKGLWESFWWTISTLLVGGADNKGPIGVGGRIIAIMWMLLSIVLVSLLTASFTTTLTVNSLKGDISGPGDLPGREVATVKGSTSETWLTTKGAKVEPLADVAACIAALKAGKVQAVVYDAPMLQYAVNQAGDEKLQMVGPIFERQNYAIGLQQDSPLRERINRALLALQERGVGMELRKKWFGEEK